MSVIDEIIVLNVDDGSMKRFNAWMRDRHSMHPQSTPLRKIDNDSVGGNKVWCVSCWIGCINHLATDEEIIEAITECCEFGGEGVQILVQREFDWDAGFKCILGEYEKTEPKPPIGIGECIWSPKAKEYRQKMFYKHCIEQAIGKAQIGSVAVHIGTSTIDPIELASYYQEVCDEEG